MLANGPVTLAPVRGWTSRSEVREEQTINRPVLDLRRLACDLRLLVGTAGWKPTTR
jgi:hypothetical protein